MSSSARALPPHTPVLIGVGQASERPGDAHYRERSPTDLAADAARAALADALPGDATAAQRLAARLDALYAVRTMADSLRPELRAAAAPFGGPDKVPRAIARRLGARPALAVYSPACGDEPQRLVGEACERLARGEFNLALLCGGEAISTTRLLQSQGRSIDWREHDDAPFEDRNANVGVLRTPYMNAHGLQRPPTIYPLFEHARRAALGMDRDAYRQAMAQLMAPFSDVAATHPHAASQRRWAPKAIAQIDAGNRLIGDPHPISVVARDQVNQGAGVLLATTALADELGVPPERRVYLHGYSALDERMVLDRPQLHRSPAMAEAYALALGAAGIGAGDPRWIDLYSCFPIAVFAALDVLGLPADDPRGLTLTGGLPFFGGAGNNYVMHALATVVERLRSVPGTTALIGANGGLLSSHAVGVYSTRPRAFVPVDSRPAQARLDAAPAAPQTPWPEGPGTVESYTVLHGRDGPQQVLVVGRCARSGGRFLANTAPGDAAALAAFADERAADPIGRTVDIRRDGERNLLRLRAT